MTLFSLGDDDDKRNCAVTQQESVSNFLFLLFQKDTTREEMQMMSNYPRNELDVLVFFSLLQCVPGSFH